MTLLVPGEGFATSNPQLHVENLLEPGSYRFQLVVVDDAQNESVPADIIVTVTSGRGLNLGNIANLVRELINPGRVVRPGG